MGVAWKSPTSLLCNSHPLLCNSHPFCEIPTSFCGIPPRSRAPNVFTRVATSNLFIWSLSFPTDIDECSMHPEGCPNGKCVNMDGGFRCKCNIGYELDETGSYCIGKVIDWQLFTKMQKMTTLKLVMSYKHIRVCSNDTVNCKDETAV